MRRLTPPRGYTTEDTQTRRDWLTAETGHRISDPKPEQPADLKGIIENHIGFMQIPLGVVGPLIINGTYAKGRFCVPICTVEGTLTISMTRGLLLTQLAGGIKTVHIKQELSRSPIFIFDEIDRAQSFYNWIGKNFAPLKLAAESTTRHGKLLRIDRYVSQSSVILDFVYNTANAAGQNMVTIATAAACKYIRETHASQNGFHYYIESNFNCDKSPASKTLLLGRGHQVVAGAMIPGKLLRRIMRATPKEYVDGWTCSTRSAQMAGVVGTNMNVANALASIYMATGQDVACVAENSVGVMTYEQRDNDVLFASLTMPSISVGTVGGGTRLAQQRENLELLGCTGENSANKLAEIICACALALELSLGGAVLSHEFASAHANYGRR
jgi:hydroxymethylglutaryl-CoA reductase (NADPH)